MGAAVFAERYEVLSRLAVGGMGEVFLAKQRDLSRRVVLKTLLPDLAADPQFREQFLHEARIAARLNHPNVVAIYEVGEHGGVGFIAMEWVDGWTFSQLRRAQPDGRLPARVAVRLVRDAARALHHAHAALLDDGRPLELVHRDVSPQNLMVRRDGAVKVLDFGIARTADRAGRTRTGQVKGKLGYMPPEQVLSQGVDARADQYALGAVLFELLTGRPRHEGDDDVARMRSILSPAALELDPGLDGVTDVLRRALAYAPEQRWSSCLELAEQLDAVTLGGDDPEPALQRLLAQLPPPDAVTAGASPLMVMPGKATPSALTVDTVSERPPRRRTGLAVAAAAAVVVFGGGAWWVTRAPRQAVAPVALSAPSPPVVAPPPSPPAVEPPPSPAPQPVVEAVRPPPTPAKRPHRPPEPVAAAPVAARPADDSGPTMLAVDTQPWSEVEVDGVKWSSTPLKRPIRPGPHTVVLTTADGRVITRKLDVKGGTTEKLKVEF